MGEDVSIRLLREYLSGQRGGEWVGINLRREKEPGAYLPASGCYQHTLGVQVSGDKISEAEISGEAGTKTSRLVTTKIQELCSIG